MIPKRHSVETVHVDDEAPGALRFGCTEGRAADGDFCRALATYVLNADHWSRGQNFSADDCGRAACEQHRPTSVEVTPGSPWPS